VAPSAKEKRAKLTSCDHNINNGYAKSTRVSEVIFTELDININ
jgi:hypothetical protein